MNASHIKVVDSLNCIIFDFDGVLTDDRVWVDQDGREMVCCSRRDGLGFDILRQSGLKLFILSTETNPVVSQRVAKLKMPAIQGCADKARALTGLGAKEGSDFFERRHQNTLLSADTTDPMQQGLGAISPGYAVRFA
jgi:3-deoxy-D-manno-octulosonate 8-phosphate phosphatase KdsC-like HAD superfamily phosphatase